MYKIQTSKDGQKWRESERRFTNRESAFHHAKSWIALGMCQYARVTKGAKLFAEYRKAEEE